MKRILAAVVAVLVIGAIGYVATSASAGTAERSSVALEGHYSGHVGHNHIRFDYTHGKVKNFRVNHSPGVSADVHDAGWSMPCIPNSSFLNSHGHWVTSHKVKGGYQFGCGNSTHFEAHWVSGNHAT